MIAEKTYVFNSGANRDGFGRDYGAITARLRRNYGAKKERKRMDSGAITVTAIALFLFGWLFNHFVNYLHRRGFNDGCTWREGGVGCRERPQNHALPMERIHTPRVVLLVLAYRCAR